jgi:hypothetical protein
METGKEEKEAIELLQKTEQGKIEKFQAAFQALCKEHGFGLSPVLTIRQGKAEGTLEVVKLK